MSSKPQIEHAARAINNEGWTCNQGADEPGSYDECEDCKRVCDKVARGALAAAHPTINTVEELRGVYAGSILEDAVGDMWGIDGETDRLFFIRDGVDETYNDDAIPLPATVLHFGSADQ